MTERIYLAVLRAVNTVRTWRCERFHQGRMSVKEFREGRLYTRCLWCGVCSHGVMFGATTTETKAHESC